MAAGIEATAARGPATTGFADPVHDAQGVFRAVLLALARPGQVQAVHAALVPPSPLSPLMAAVALTLLDQDVTAWLSPSLAQGAGEASVRGYLAFHTGTRSITAPGMANFIVCAAPADIPALETLAQGTPAYPDRSATVIVDVSGVDVSGVLEAPSVSATLSGPGLEHPLAIAIPGFSRALWRQLHDNHGRYPLGVDLVVCTAGGVIGLPRSTRIEVA